MQFSIIIPAKNEEARIGQCIDSLVNLDWDREEFEIIVVDNGSVDQTAAIAGERGAKVFVEPGLTISALRNRGADSAQGRILAFLDADCTVRRDWLRNAAPYLPRQDIVCFGSPPVVPDHATWVQEAWFQVRRKKPHGEITWLESMNMFVRREIFTAAGGFSEDLITCEDYDLSLRLGRFGTLMTDERIVAVHHGEAMSVGHFFRKECWRGTGNIHGLKHHGISWREVPSIAIPPVYCALAFLAPGWLIAALLTTDKRVLLTASLVLLAWQVPLAGLALWKNGLCRSVVRMIQLYFLLNIYFLARGYRLLQRSEG